MALITLDSVTVDFPLYNMETRSLKQRIIKLGTLGRFRNKSGKKIVARGLDEVSLSIHHGDRVGLIGRNGAGKSTLLRVIAGIYEPTVGQLEIEGRVTPMLDVMLGIDPEFTGYENIMMRSILMGMRKEEVRERLGEIAEFTELKEHLDVPVRTYSAGMKLRLAMGVATSMQPDILVMDEIVGAADIFFMEKMQAKLNTLIDQSSIVVLASHSMPLIKDFCNKAIVLEEGRVCYFGDIDEAESIYR